MLTFCFCQLAALGDLMSSRAPPGLSFLLQGRSGPAGRCATAHRQVIAAESRCDGEPPWMSTDYQVSSISSSVPSSSISNSR
jgi:hypothetical protein